MRVKQPKLSSETKLKTLVYCSAANTAGKGGLEAHLLLVAARAVSVLLAKQGRPALRTGAHIATGAARKGHIASARPRNEGGRPHNTERAAGTAAASSPWQAAQHHAGGTQTRIGSGQEVQRSKSTSQGSKLEASYCIGEAGMAVQGYETCVQSWLAIQLSEAGSAFS